MKIILILVLSFFLKMAEAIQITVVYDNNPYRDGLKTGWGFSCVIKTSEDTVLFDTGGDGKILLSNMKKLGIDPKEINRVVLSHIHADHTGGLKDFLEENPSVKVYIPASFPKDIEDFIKEKGADPVRIKEKTLISKDIYSTGELGLFIKEQSLVICTEKGLVLITGCAHPGIVNIAKKVKEMFKKEIFLIMGGFHLVWENESEIKRIISELKKIGVKCFGPCHCSGDLARKLFKEAFGNCYIDIGVGRRIEI